jgi:hypothetical protein
VTIEENLVGETPAQQSDQPKRAELPGRSSAEHLIYDNHPSGTD